MLTPFLRGPALALCLMAPVLSLAPALTPTPAMARDVTDSAGRVVDVPDTVSRVVAAGVPASVILYALAPDRLANWARAPSDLDLVLPVARDLPVTGRLTEKGGEANLEAVLALAPDLIVDYGTISPRFAEGADRMQARTGIPVLLIDGDFDAIPEALRILGGALDVPVRAEALARDAEVRLAANDALAAAIAEDARPAVWLARGPGGRETGPEGSISTEIVERAGARNAAGPGEAGATLFEASAEQILQADPQVVVTLDRDFATGYAADPVWGATAAGRAGRVYLAPSAPFGWIDSPPSVNRLIGLSWMADLLWPGRDGADLREDARAFHGLWYQVTLTDAQLDALLGGE